MIILNDFTGDIPVRIHRKNICAGVVLCRNNKYTVIERKILFEQRTMNINGKNQERNDDLLYDSPNYKSSASDENLICEKFYIGDVVKLSSYLEYLGFDEILNETDIRKIYNIFLSPSSKLFKGGYQTLRISAQDLFLLERTSGFKKKPSRYEKKETQSKCKSKVKTYTFR